MHAVAKAFKEVKRSNFLPPEQIENVNVDAPLPIGFGQTNSQPTTVRMMLEWLDVKLGNKVLDIGAGSGWTTALLSSLTGSGGKVYAVEIIPELAEFGRQNCQRAGVKNAKFYQANKEYGLSRFAPYDRILVSAAGQSIPQELLDQLKTGGKMIIPINHEVLEVEKLTNGQIKLNPHIGFAFVPLIQPV